MNHDGPSKTSFAKWNFIQENDYRNMVKFLRFQTLFIGLLSKTRHPVHNTVNLPFSIPPKLTNRIPIMFFIKVQLKRICRSIPLPHYGCGRVQLHLLNSGKFSSMLILRNSFFEQPATSADFWR